MQYQRPPISKEMSNFRAIQIHKQPNSKRTLIPDLGVSNSFKNINPY